MADIREQLLAAFKVEYREHVDAIRAALGKVAAGEAVNLREVFRRAHSLKGAARAVDLPQIETQAHTMEEQFARAMESGGALDAGQVQRMGGLLDAIERTAGELYGPKPEKGPAEVATTEFLRINAEQVQRLSASMHELSTSLDMLDGDADDLRGLHARAEGLARMLEETGRHAPLDTARLAQEARSVARALSSAMRQQRDAVRTSLAATGRLREEVGRMALAPASSVLAGLDVMVRDIAKETGKSVEVKIEGLSTQADRLLLQSLRDPVTHLLRNAVAHGLETPTARRAAGRPETGEVGLTVKSRAGRLEISVYDDGRGPDLARIEAVAVRRGLLKARSESDPPPSTDQLLALVFEPGFSTAGSVDRISGRGMGLSVVAEAARRAGGGAFMRRRAFGTEVVISTPLSAARQPILLAYDGGQIYGLPTRAIERVVQAPVSALERVDGRLLLNLSSGGNTLTAPVVLLNRVLGATALPREEPEIMSIAVLRQGDLRLGVAVDALDDVRVATVVALTHPDVDDLVQGAAQLERDQVAIVVNPEALMRRYARNAYSFHAGAAAPKSAVVARRTILVVDDSVTTRTLEKSILEASGFTVLLAVDGVDALDRLRSSASAIDLVVADVEMPRMDGFQLLAAIKGDAQFARLPVIMMTSRASPEDVRRGMELGADAYLVKQTFDQKELLTTVGQLL